MSERKKKIGTIFLSIGSIIILFEILGIFTGTLGGPPILYFLGGALDGLGMVFFLGGFAIREEYGKNREMI
ncbi:MAG: hypothetical protein ACW96M_02825 [Candidatus Thorarchaeota archaeon]|jgi:hypothetical protein